MGAVAPGPMACSLCGEGEVEGDAPLAGCCGCTSPCHVSCAFAAAALDLTSSEKWTRCERCGQPFRGELRLELARAHYERTEDDDRPGGEPGQEHQSACNNLASALAEELGDYAGAQKLLEQQLASQRRSLPQDHAWVLTSLANLAGLLIRKGELRAALPLCEEALVGRRRTLGDEHEATVLSLCQMSTLYRQLGDVARALALLEEALAVQRRTLGAEHEGTIRSLVNLSDLHMAAGDGAAACGLAMEAVSARRRLLGAAHPDTLRVMCQLAQYTARCTESPEQMAEARALAQEALDGARRALGGEHVDTLRAMTTLAMIHMSTGDGDASLPLYREALVGQRSCLGNQHPETLSAMGNLALLSWQVANAGGGADGGEALALLDEAVAGCHAVLGESHPQTGAFVASLEKFRREQKLQLQAQASGATHLEPESELEPVPVPEPEPEPEPELEEAGAAAPPNRSPATWSTGELCSWLSTTMKLGDVSAAAEAEEVDGATALEMERADWMELGARGVQAAKIVAALKQQLLLLQQQQDQIARSTVEAAGSGAEGSNLIAQLSQLAKLRQDGGWTEAEFSAAKAKLLALANDSDA